jgi:hypothetical protein
MRTLSILTLALLASGCACNLGNGDYDEANPYYLADPQNFSYTGDIYAPNHETVSGENVEICFDGLSHDIQCHEVDPSSDPGIVTLARFNNLSEEEVEEQISNDTLPQSAISGYLSVLVEPGETCVQLEDMSLQGTEIVLEEEYYEGGGTYLVLVGAGDEPGMNTLSMDFFVPLEASDVTGVDIEDACSTLDFLADVASSETAALPSEAEELWVDWGDLTVTGLGNPINLAKIDGLMLGHYAELSVAELEESFLDLELIASELYTMDLGGTFSADLYQASGDDGAFTGFTADGTWVLALTCSTCSNPAPLFLTVVEPQ